GGGAGGRGNRVAWSGGGVARNLRSPAPCVVALRPLRPTSTRATRRASQERLARALRPPTPTITLPHRIAWPSPSRPPRVLARAHKGRGGMKEIKDRIETKPSAQAGTPGDPT